MALKDTWVDKVDDKDDVEAEIVNSLAHSIIDLETNQGGKDVDLTNYYTKDKTDTAIKTAIGDVLGGAS